MAKTLAARIDEMVAARVEAALASLLGADETTVSAAPHDVNRAVYARTVARIENKAPRTRSRIASTAYATAWDRRKTAPEWVVGNERLVFDVLVRSRQPLTNRELETRTSLGKKAVESSVWRLRNHAANMDRHGKPVRVKPGVRALVQSVSAE